MTVEEHGTRPAAASGSLAERARRAVWWLGASSFASSGIRLVASLILTRLLAPDVYGLVAVAQALVFGLSMLSDVGLQHSLTRSHRADDPDYLSAIWTLQAIRGLWISALMLASAALLFALQATVPHWLSDSVYAHPHLPGLVALIALSPILDGVASIKAALAQRAMDMGRLSLLELAGHFITVVLTIVLALHYPTAWVLVGMSVFSTALRCVGTHLLLPGPRTRWHYDPAVARETWQFGRWILASSGMTFVATHGDRMLLAALTTPAVLGQFAIARNLSGLPSTLIAALIGSVGYSTLCEIARERPAELNHHFARVQRKVDLVCMGCAGLLLPAGPLIVAVLFDDRYLDAGWMVSLMSLALLMQRFLLVDQLALTLGDSAWLARKQAVAVTSLFGGIALGHWLGGVTGAVVGATLSPLAVLPMALLRMHRLGVLSVAVEVRAWAALAAGAGLSLLADRAVRAAAAALGHPLP